MSMARQLVDGASAPYRAAGHYAYHYARGKLTHDPVFEALLARGLLTRHTVILDLGCGQGLLAALLLAARAASDCGAWPAHWPPSPQPSVVRGIELMDRQLRRAQRALGRRAEFIAGDVRRVDFGNADVVVILDVLHYLAYADQRAILERVRRAQRHGCVAAARRRRGRRRGFCTRKVDRSADSLLAGGFGINRLYCRTAGEWRALLSATGFDSEIMPMSGGTIFANVLLVAKPT